MGSVNVRSSQAVYALSRSMALNPSSTRSWGPLQEGGATHRTFICFFLRFSGNITVCGRRQKQEKCMHRRTSSMRNYLPEKMAAPNPFRHDAANKTRPQRKPAQWLSQAATVGIRKKFTPPRHIPTQVESKVANRDEITVLLFCMESVLVADLF